ncbi:hypothetical protein PVIIG_04269 [Plasmodium vivax India VII]|uniref:Uncharacterized protein n=3 Tax=Plasmodium vivax TaxID=5855 RepID=A0A0J9TH18_PLAVI|nr:hypothetical protein PVIIG_04269 [Plasmodium vivax India VII]KMZ94331.1 hypothetical protein PVMG_05383 [Plasmodium vivax Mauritania I]VUZ94214.1 conserved Plasmodium protein, unknown function [Plasmodium vivax]
MVCAKFVFLFCFPLLTIVWRDVDGRDVNEVKIVVDPVDWGAPGEGKRGKADSADTADSEDTEEGEEGDEEEEEAEEEEDEPDDDSETSEGDPPEGDPTAGNNNQQNNIEDIINDYYTNVLIPKESKEQAEMEEERKNMPLITRIKNFFIKKKEEKKEGKKPSTLMEYIRQKNKKILELEEEGARRYTTKNIYKYLFWTSAYVLLNVAIVPLITYFYVSKRCKDAIMKEYQNNRDRRIVPHGYDFSSDRPSVKISGNTFRNCKYYLPQQGDNFSFLVGMLRGDPYAIIKL